MQLVASQAGFVVFRIFGIRPTGNPKEHLASRFGGQGVDEARHIILPTDKLLDGIKKVWYV